MALRNLPIDKILKELRDVSPQRPIDLGRRGGGIALREDRAGKANITAESITSVDLEAMGAP